MKKEWVPLIIDALYEATEAIMGVYTGNFEVIIKSDHSPVTIADKQSNVIIQNALKKTGVLIVSEESEKPPYETRKNEDIWLVDPLDGTKEFVKKNDEFAICIAYVSEHRSIFGIIADPVNRQIIFGGENIPPALISYGEEDIFSSKHHLAKLKGDKIDHIIYSRTHYTPRIDKLLEKLEHQYGHIDRILKGSALKFFDLVQDHAQLYPRLWPTMEWDIAAGNAIYSALGGEVLDFNTFAPLEYNKEDLHNPQFIAKPKELQITTDE
ncbi:3'(2'),5'-bisphosphate nucleotidase CysQ [Paracrocinitomix mangrovi]|uniref:3'(2'),5'-bisphosphate nucleotidase CysQ family protein n=1 Tax=Paracrocinitomix mangrovi TaxID=2862509 RepID=UPI001C8E061C|nr:inositol monophosphatase family protein [Paracrocinitomix mangrovi]UKN03417.1 3'(2'),5'-bisphosphate nucleotidase CysQ [Paracrocinitomix mangrovi]